MSNTTSRHLRRRAHSAALVLLVVATSGCQLPSWLVGAVAEAEPEVPVTTPAPPPQPVPTSTITPPTTTPPTPSTTTPTTAPPTTGPPTTTPTPASALTLCSTGTASGPSDPPSGAVTIPVGSDPSAITGAHGAGTTYWFARGTHTPSAAIDAQAGDRFLGAPGAVLDGGFAGIAAFTGGGAGVTIRGLTIQRFGTTDGRGWVNGAAINRSVAARWTVEDNTIRLNDGNALFLGDGSTTRRNCFSENGQTGLAAPAQQRSGGYISLTGIVVTGNEIRGNNRNDIESAPGACTGCTGGMKLWQTTGAIVSGNTVVDNHGVGIWLDNNNVDALVDDNIVAGNDREGIMVETSYNSRVTNNVVTGNAVVDGRRRSGSFPIAGVFISNSGGSPRLAGTVGIEVSGNRIEDNWNGVVVFWDADRYCGSASDTSVGHCTLGGATLASCATQVEQPPSPDAFVENCHWGSVGVSVHDNEFVTSAALVAGCNGRCGRNGLIASAAPASTRVRLADGTVRTVRNPLGPDWARERVVNPGTNRFWSNRYSGSWRFDLRSPGQTLTGEAWRGTGQDAA